MMADNGEDRNPSGPEPPMICRITILHTADNNINLNVEPQNASAVEVYGLLEIARELMLKNRLTPREAQPRIVGVKTLPPGLG